jgi:hypothetical protein
MPKKSDASWAGKKQLPSQIPPYKAPRLARGQDNIPFSELKEKRKQDKEKNKLRAETEETQQASGTEAIETEKTVTEAIITETEPETEMQDSDGEEDNIPFG